MQIYLIKITKRFPAASLQTLHVTQTLHMYHHDTSRTWNSILPLPFNYNPPTNSQPYTTIHYPYPLPKRQKNKIFKCLLNVAISFSIPSYLWGAVGGPGALPVDPWVDVVGQEVGGYRHTGCVPCDVRHAGLPFLLVTRK